MEKASAAGWDEHKESLVEKQGRERDLSKHTLPSSVGLCDGGSGSAGLAVRLSGIRGLFQPKRTSSQWEEDASSQSLWKIFIPNPRATMDSWNHAFLFVSEANFLKHTPGAEHECAAGFSGFSCPWSPWKGPGWLDTKGGSEQRELTRAAPSCSSEHALVHGSV